MISKIKIWLQKYVLFQVNALISIFFFVGFEKRKIIFSFVVFPLLAEPLNRTSGGQAKNGWLEEVQNTSRGDWLLATASWTV